MLPIADAAREGIPPDVATPALTRHVGIVAGSVAFLVFTVWVNYAIRYVIPEGIGTVAALGDLKVGAPAPVFTLGDLDGNKVSLESMRGEKTVLIEFWASWCPPCRMVLATLRAMAQTLKDENVEVLSVNRGETAEAVRAFVAKEGTPFRVVLDPEETVATRYYVTSLPTMFLVDKRGIVRWIRVGHMPDTDELRNLLRRIARE